VTAKPPLVQGRLDAGEEVVKKCCHALHLAESGKTCQPNSERKARSR
jgi:hypothetical protein